MMHYDGDSLGGSLTAAGQTWWDPFQRIGDDAAARNTMLSEERELADSLLCRDLFAAGSWARTLDLTPEGSAVHRRRHGRWEYWTILEPGMEHFRLLRRPAAATDGPHQDDDGQVVIDFAKSLPEDAEISRLQVSPDGEFVLWLEDQGGDERYRLSCLEVDTAQLRRTSACLGRQLVIHPGGGSVYAVERAHLGGAQNLVRWSLPDLCPAAAVPQEAIQPGEWTIRATGGDVLAVHRSGSETSMLILTGQCVAIQLPVPPHGVRTVECVRSDGERICLGLQPPDKESSSAVLWMNRIDARKPVWEPVARAPYSVSWQALAASGNLVILQGESFGQRFISYAEVSPTLTALDFHAVSRRDEDVLLRRRDGDSLELALESWTRETQSATIDLQTREWSIKATARRPSEPVSQMILVPATDGARIPMTFVTSGATSDVSESAPTILLAYGSYGRSYPRAFHPAWTKALKAGVRIAIAHVRGGGELGEPWHRSAQGRAKGVAVDDLICCATQIRELTACPGKLAAFGTSAGALLVTAAAIRRPDLFDAVAAQSPFVDPLGTLLREDNPLAAADALEFGCPGRDANDLLAIQHYSPYDNIRAVKYPPMLFTAGINDARVNIREPLKLVRRLRADGRGGPFVLRVTASGHVGGPRVTPAIETALLPYAWMLRHILAAEAYTHSFHPPHIAD